MGVGRFVFTPVLPLMEAQAHLTSAQASTLATSNYLGYLIGAVLGIMLPALSRARLALRVSGVVLVATLAAMPLTRDVAAWAALRGLAGVASAVIFMVAGNTILTELDQRPAAHDRLGVRGRGGRHRPVGRARRRRQVDRRLAGRVVGVRRADRRCCWRRRGSSG